MFLTSLKYCSEKDSPYCLLVVIWTRNVPHHLGLWSTWSPHDDTSWGAVGSVTLLEELHPCRTHFEMKSLTHFQGACFALCKSRCERLVPVLAIMPAAHCHAFLPGCTLVLVNIYAWNAVIIVFYHSNRK